MAPRVPAAVGGVGGSGTRLLSQFLQSLGYYIGGDLNQSLDNLWFTLLFKRANILDATPEVRAELYQLFRLRMTGQPLSPEQRRIVDACASHARLQHDRDWLQARAASFLDAPPPSAGSLWGWKEPNTHVLIEEFLALDPQLHYIHVMRNGLDMAYSGNQNQLELWGPGVLGAAADRSPRQSLAYWVHVHRRIRDLAAREPRTILLDYDRLCRHPHEELPKLLQFLSFAADPTTIANLIALVAPPASVGRFRSHGTSEFDPADVQFVAEMGFDVE